MPPKTKKSKTRSFQDVPVIQRSLDEWLQSVYALRHNGDAAVTTHDWPVENGGTFLDIAMRAQEDEDRLLNATLRLCQKADLVDADMALETFKDKFLKMQVGKSKKSFPVDIIYRVWN